jgi:hypothetical protein
MNAVFLCFQVFLQCFAFLDELLLELLHLFKVARRGGICDGIFQGNLSFRNLGFALGFQFGDFFLLGGGQFGHGRTLVEAFHGEFVGRFHSCFVLG